MASGLTIDLIIRNSNYVNPDSNTHLFDSIPFRDVRCPIPAEVKENFVLITSRNAAFTSQCPSSHL